MQVETLVNPNDLGNGWYALPPVSLEMIQPIVEMLVTNGAPPNVRIYTPPFAKWGNEPQKAPPTEIQFASGDRLERFDAVRMYYGPQITWVEICNVFGLPIRPLVFPEAPKVVAVKNPIGPLIDATKNYYSTTGGDDRFKDGAILSDSTGTYKKHEGFLSLFTRAWWEKVA